MRQQHHYVSKLSWTGNRGSGTATYRGYDRSHTIIIEGKPAILCSSDAAFRGDPARHTPEDLLLASLSSCHMLWYLHLCAEAGIIVNGYEDEAKATMVVEEDGGGQFAEAHLYPRVWIYNTEKEGEAIALHKRANELCFIARSCNFPIHHHAEIFKSG